MNQSENESIKIIDQDLLKEINLEDWEVINENKIVNKKTKLDENNIIKTNEEKKKSIELKNLTKNYNEEIDQNEKEISDTIKNKKYINLKIEIPETNNIQTIQKPKKTKKDRLIIKDIEDVLKKKIADDIIDLLILLPDDIHVVFAIKAFQVNNYHIGNTLSWIVTNDREAQSLKRMINRRFYKINKSNNKNSKKNNKSKKSNKFYIWIKNLFQCVNKRKRSKVSIKNI